DQPRVVGLMYVMLLLGMGASAVIFGALLENYSPARLVQVIQGAAVVTVALNLAALWKQEARDRRRAMAPPAEERFLDAFAALMAAPGARRRLTVIGLGTMGFGMADVILEPYGGQVLGMSVAETTRLTAMLALGGLAGLALASRVLARGGEPMAVARAGAIAGMPGFAAIMLAAPAGTPAMVALGTMAIGFGAGLFGHGTLTATMRAADTEKAGLALGAWGAVQATAAGVAIAAAGVIRDVILALAPAGEVAMGAHGPAGPGVAAAYMPVFALEVLCLAAAAAVAAPLVTAARRGAKPAPADLAVDGGEVPARAGMATAEGAAGP
ncbi:MAG: MFS transporter, partial [Pseudomonadota bacterium]